MFGIERVNFFGRFNFYYGMDYGPYYSYFKTGYAAYISYSTNGYMYFNYTYNNSTSSFYTSPSETTKYGLTIAPFIGVKYRISGRFSASIESAFYLSYYYSISKLFAQPNYYSNNNGFNQSTFTTVATKNVIHGLEFSPKYLRFLTFNYHF